MGTEDGVEHGRGDPGGDGGPELGVDMAPEVCSGAGGRQVGGLGHGGDLVAEDGAGNDGACHDAEIGAVPLRQGDAHHASGAGGRPARAGHGGHDGAGEEGA